jgi:2-methylcitrate dehydratase
VKEDPELTALYPKKGMPNRVTVELEGGRTLSKQFDIPRGHPRNPMTERDVEEKFLRLTKKKLGTKKSRRALERLWRLEETDDLREVFSLLRISQGRSKP